MADYKELIRKAIQALPENNGASRRAVYEKARAALVGQLRGLDPPLSAREITQHRLQLEDCIRQVEQEASEAVIAGLKQNEQLAAPRPTAANSAAPVSRSPTSHAAKTSAEVRSRPVGRAANGDARGSHRPAAQPPAPVATLPAKGQPVAAAGRPGGAAQAVARKAVAYPELAPGADAEPGPETIEAIIAADEVAAVGSPDQVEADPHVEANGHAAPEEDDGANGSNVIELPEPADPPMFRLEPRPAGRKPGSAVVQARALPAIVARAEALKTAKPSQSARRPSDPRGIARPAGAAMSSVREVDLESHEGDPQVTIERAIATLEREAQNDGEEVVNGVDSGLVEARGNDAQRRRTAEASGQDVTVTADPAFARPAEPERGGGNAITIFLLVFLVLMVAAGGGGFWAWREGYIDFNSMFGRTPQVAIKTPVGPSAPVAPATPAAAPAASAKTPATASAAQTNTESAPSAPSQSTAQLSTAPAPKAPLPSSPLAPAPSANSAEPSAGVSSAPKSEERLSQAPETPAPVATPDTATAGANGTPVTNPAGGSQSLLLEASQDGTTGAVPFSGTVEWHEGKDELGQPTLMGKADIPARNLAVTVLIRKNSDPTLPASNLMEINFTVGQSFIGGSIAGLPGVLMKNEELVPGTQLIGASARVVGNSFLFALSSSPADEATNRDLLTSGKWLDLAIIYATGKRAILTLEKDDKAQGLFSQVFDAWSKEAAASPTPATAPKPATPPPASSQ